MELGKLNKNSFHLAGVVPIAGSTTEFNIPGHGVLMPISPDLNLIQRSVLECAYAGCESIWIVCNDDIAPIVKHSVGDSVYDPVSLEAGSYIQYPDKSYLSIPIYYVPIHPKHRDKIDCYAWSVLHGANVAYWVCRRLGRWTIPDKYYVSFPCSVYDPAEIKNFRTVLPSKKSFYFSYKGKTVCDGMPLGFSFDASEWKRARTVIKSNSRLYSPPSDPDMMPSERLPPEERYKSRNFNLEDVFGGAETSDAELKELSWIYDLTFWSEYCKLVTSDNLDTLRKPYGFVTGKINIGEQID